MPGLLGTTKLYEITEQAKSILKIHGDFSFFAIPTDLLNKYGIESFDIIDSDNKIILVAHGTERAGTENHTPIKMEVI